MYSLSLSLSLSLLSLSFSIVSKVRDYDDETHTHTHTHTHKVRTNGKWEQTNGAYILRGRNVWLSPTMPVQVTVTPEPASASREENLGEATGSGASQSAGTAQIRVSGALGAQASISSIPAGGHVDGADGHLHGLSGLHGLDRAREHLTVAQASIGSIPSAAGQGLDVLKGPASGTGAQSETVDTGPGSATGGPNEAVPAPITGGQRSAAWWWNLLGLAVPALLSPVAAGAFILFVRRALRRRAASALGPADAAAGPGRLFPV